MYLFSVLTDRPDAEMRGHPSSSVHDGCRRSDQLQWGDLKRLAKGHGCQFHRPHIFFFMHDGRRLTRQIHPRFAFQAKLDEIMIILLYPKSLSHIDKYRVTGIHRSL